MPTRPPKPQLLLALIACVASLNCEWAIRTSCAEDNYQLAVSASCSNASCHGAGAGEKWRQAYTIWATEDPHASAYRVLYRSASRDMVKKLELGKQLGAAAYREYVDTHCAVCHATSGPLIAATHAATGDAPAHPPHSPQFSAGVACQSCHGAADTWLDAHHLENPPEQSQLKCDAGEWRVTNADYGLLKLSDPVTRARTCVGCHVGSAGDDTTPRREVNHDLIAAGHPRLAFEYTSHVANMPPHWDEEPESAARSVNEWAIGQFVAADAAIELLVARAGQNEPGGVWPEFSEYNCASCHHNLRGKDTRTAQDFPADRPRGAVYDWGSWYFPLVADAAPTSEKLTANLSNLRIAMSPLSPNKEDVRAAAEHVQRELRQAIEDFGSADTAAIVARLQQEPASRLEWDTAVQRYLWQAHAQDAVETKDVRLVELFKKLEPAPHHNGPLWVHYEHDEKKQQ